MLREKTIFRQWAYCYTRRDVLLTVLVLGLFVLTICPLQAQQQDRYKVQWRDYTFYTDKEMITMPGELTLEAYPDSVEEGYYFVQFAAQITQQDKEEFYATGGDLHNYVPNNTYIAKMTVEEKALVEALPGVQWVGIFQPAMKLSERLTRRVRGEEIEPRVRPYPLEFGKPDTLLEIVEYPPLHLTILIFKGEDLERISEAVSRLGGVILSAKQGKYRSKLRITCPTDKVYDLAMINGIIWIEEFTFPELHNDIARGVMRVTQEWNNHALKGNGQIIGIGDTGLDSGVDDASMHDDIEGRIANIFSWAVQPGYGALNSNADDGANDLDSGHGTYVSGSVLGNGKMSGGTFSGVAPDASLIFQAVEQFTDWPAVFNAPRDGYYLTGIPDDLNDLFQQAYDAGARIHTNSWGGNEPGAYSDNSEEVDEFVWDHPDMLILFSAGNAGVNYDGNNIVDLGSVNPPGTAKNCLTVGASENTRLAVSNTWSSHYGSVIDNDPQANNASGMAAFSSRGPANANTASSADDRIKPDLVAPGTMVASTRSQASPNTVWFIDDMESGPAGWTGQIPWAQITTDAHSASTSWHDSPGGDYGNNVNISLTSPNRNLSGGGLGDKILQFFLHYDLGSGDGWYLEVSSDGGVAWAQLGPFTGTQTDWELWSIGLGGFSNSTNFRVRFRLRSNNDGMTGDGLYIDDVRIVEGAFRTALLSDFGVAPVGSANDQNYLLMNGTSMATPLTAGAAAIVRQYYIDEMGLGYVSAALLRATLINGAVDISPGQYGVGANQEIGTKPNNVEGWGRVDLEQTIFPAAPAVLHYVDELTGLGTGQSKTHAVDIKDSSVPLSITMVYHDYPGAGIINNLDMTVTTPGGTILYPNGLTTNDTRNNVEQIVVPTPVRGTYTITIRGQNVPQGPQPYAIAISAGTEEEIFLKWTLSLHGGTAVPLGTYADTFDLSYNILLDVDYHLSPRVAIVGFFGYNDFKSKISAIDNTYWLNLSLNLRYYTPIALLATNRLSFYVEAGPGLYIPKDGDVKFGYNIGGGFNYRVNPHVFLETGIDYHYILDRDIQFIHNHLGVVFHF